MSACARGLRALPSVIQIDSERAQYWLGNGAQPTEAVAALLKITGDWQQFKGEPGTEGTLRVKAPKTSKKDLYEAALAAAGKTGDDGTGATTPRKRPAKKAEPAVEANAADAPAAEAPAADVSVAPVVEAPAEETPAVQAGAPAAEATDGEKA